MTQFARYLSTMLAVLLALAASAAFASSPVKITDCTKAASRPKQLTLTCADANAVLGGLRWSSFGGATAKARGTLEMNRCEPNCAQGKVARYPIAATARGIRKCAHGLRVYNRLTLSFTTGRVPSHARAVKSWTLRCPR
jgi:hypothetical protein